MLHTLSTLVIGYSVFSAIVIALVMLSRRRVEPAECGAVFGVTLLLVLGSMQFIHYLYLLQAELMVQGVVYRMLLFSAAPLFYLFARPFLYPGFRFSGFQLMHLLPVVVAPFLSYEAALPLAFVIGVLYLLMLGRLVYRLRGERDRFSLEITLLALLFILGLAVAIAGFSVASIGETLFYQVYAIAIGMLFIVISFVLLRSPGISSEVVEVVREAYAVTTLASVDCDAAIARLESQMRDDKLYMQVDLGLKQVADKLDLGAHQLSELINTRLGKSFPRYLREYRVAAAETMLLAEPSASVLSVGLAVGFSSQSSFYDAFREITGMTPGKYRQLHQQPSPY